MSLEQSDTHGTKPTLALAMGDPAGISPELTARLLALDEVRQQARLIVLGDLANLAPDTVERGVATREGGSFALANYRLALTMGRDARADAVCFTPFNKQATRLPLPAYHDEERLFSAGRGVDVA